MGFCLRHNGRDFKLVGTLTIGRHESCALPIDDALISRRHATFTLVGDTVAVEDLGSRNGVLVNGVRVQGRQELRPGDKVTVGSQEILLVVDEKAPGQDVFNDAHTVTTGKSAMDAIPISQSQPPVDFVSIGGRDYAVVPKEEYLRLIGRSATVDGIEVAAPSRRGGKKSRRH